MKRVLCLLIFALLAPLAGCNGQEIAVDMSKTETDTNAPPANLSSALVNANRENKLLLLEFSSSDSCPPCVLLQQRVFSSPEFKAFAETNLVFVRLDFPLKAALRPDTVATNALLAQQFDTSAWPTFVALDKSGKEFWRQEGINLPLLEPSNFINLLKDVKNKEQ